MKKATKEVYLGEWNKNQRQGWGKVFNHAGQLTFDGNFDQGRFIERRQGKMI